jgi:thiol-disulfide isomerase/thioredoxin
MTKFFILPMLLLATISSHAQYRRTQMQMPVADKTKEIPMKPIVVEGELAGVPDGTPVQFAFRVKRTRAWDTANNTLVDTLRNGKFHIEKKFIYKDFDENDDNMEYMINVEGKALFVYAYPGAKVKVTGNPSTRQDVITWKAESDHPLQKEFYEYRAYEQEKLAPIRKKIQEAYEADDVDEALVQKLGRQRDSINVVSMLDFMKNKECNSVFAMYLSSISNKAMRLGNKQLKDRILNLFLTKVPVDYDDQNAVEAKGFLSSGEQLKIGAQSKDFTLYDRKGKEHRISEFKGKYTILEFTSKFCGPCLAMLPELEGLYKRNNDRMELVAISVDPESIWMKEDNKLSYHDWNDHKCAVDLANVYGAKGTPCFVIIDPECKVLDVSHGAGAFYKAFVKCIPDAEIEKMLCNNK